VKISSATILTALRSMESQRVKYPLLRQSIDELRALLVETLEREVLEIESQPHGAERDWLANLVDGEGRAS